MGADDSLKSTHSSHLHDYIVWVLQLGLFDFLHLDPVRTSIVNGFHDERDSDLAENSYVKRVMETYVRLGYFFFLKIRNASSC